MTEQNKRSTQLAEYLYAEEITIGAKKTPGIAIHYKWLNSDDPEKKRTINYFKGGLNPETNPNAGDSLEVLSKLKKNNGDRFVVVKEEKPNPQNPSQPYWNLREFKDVSTWEDKPVSTFKKWGTSGGVGKTYDDTGVKVGAARNQAIAFLAATKGTSFTLDDVDKTAELIITRQAAQETKLRAAKADTAALAATDNNDKHQRDDETALTNSKGGDEDSIPF